MKIISEKIEFLKYLLKGFTDVFGFDPDLLMMIPQPCKAFILLYKITETAEKLRSEEEEGLKDDKRSEKPFWMKQTIGNACGTIAIIHALANLKVRKYLDTCEFFNKIIFIILNQLLTSG